MERLYRLTGFALPASHLLYLPIQVATLWNVHLLAALEGWRRNAGGGAGGAGARGWLDALGEVEALGALGGLAYDNPDWTFPQYLPDQEEGEGALVLEAGALAHPLLPPDVRVPNDVRVGPPGTFLLVTGSNMAGKSTLLRALGANVVLAGAGAPVCARRFRLPPLRLWTAMRVEDSLRGGVSTFLAEARRIKAVADAASALGARAPGPRLLYLLDEPFRGTNARERRIAVQRVIAHLVGSGAIGAVATHDLDLADGPPLAPAARPVHFAETVVAGAGGPWMTFDYRARPGLATTTNALRVLELVGLPSGDGALSGSEEAKVRLSKGGLGT
jgi:DNA mismatch repair ATPase MutS